jgi:hypothetical protein
MMRRRRASFVASSAFLASSAAEGLYAALGSFTPRAFSSLSTTAFGYSSRVSRVFGCCTSTGFTSSFAAFTASAIGWVFRPS